MTDDTATVDRAGKKYWDRSWENDAPSAGIDPSHRGIRNYVNRRFARLFSDVLSPIARSKAYPNLLEAGCGRSVWLPYFQKQLGFNVTGIDYSEIGCQRARAILSRHSIPGNIVCADFFSPPDELREHFDAVFSNGVVEHFDKTQVCLRSFAGFLKPQGIMITVIPNLVGAIGFLQKLLDKNVYNVHVPLDTVTLTQAHMAAGLEVLNCQYFLFANSGILTLPPETPHSMRLAAKELTVKALAVGLMIAWLVDGDCGRLPANRLTSPFIVCVARKRQPTATDVSLPKGP